MIRAVGEPGWSLVHKGVNEVSRKSSQYLEKAPTYMNLNIVSPPEIEIFVRKNASNKSTIISTNACMISQPFSIVS